MKGLIYKDLMILSQQAKSLLIIVMCGIFMAFSFEGEFVIGYMSVVTALAVIGTIGYDEFDHGYSFLFSLPVHRRTYVREKYLLTFLAVLATDLLGIVIITVISLVRHTPIEPVPVLEGSLVMMGVALMMAGLSLPLRIKYGTEKSRLAQYIIYAAVLVIVLGAKWLAELLHIDVSAMNGLNADLAVPVILAVFALLYLVSEKISERIIVKKEF
jgi:hypothetical protein